MLITRFARSSRFVVASSRHVKVIGKPVSRFLTFFRSNFARSDRDRGLALGGRKEVRIHR